MVAFGSTWTVSREGRIYGLEDECMYALGLFLGEYEKQQ